MLVESYEKVFVFKFRNCLCTSLPAPCTPGHVEHTYSCETGIALLSWDETLGRKSFFADVRSGDHMASCYTSQTHCSLSSLLCGRIYDVKVISLSDHCNSSMPGITQIKTGTTAGLFKVLTITSKQEGCFYKIYCKLDSIVIMEFKKVLIVSCV